MNEQQKMNYIKNADNQIYTDNDICPHCGTYTPDGRVCTNCLKQNDLFEPKTEYIEM